MLIYSPGRLSRKYAYQVLLSEGLSRCREFLKDTDRIHAGGSTSFQGMIAEYERAQIAERCRPGKSAWCIRVGKRAFREHPSATDT